jgi:hypothetical protein
MKTKPDAIIGTSCDMGSIKIYTDDVSVFFLNEVGDVPTTTEVYHKKSKKSRNEEFLGHFTVKTRAFLSAYDCMDDPIYEFPKGRWFVYLKAPAQFIIEKEDEDLHA